MFHFRGLLSVVSLPFPPCSWQKGKRDIITQVMPSFPQLHCDAEVCDCHLFLQFSAEAVFNSGQKNRLVCPLWLLRCRSCFLEVPNSRVPGNFIWNGKWLVLLKLVLLWKGALGGAFCVFISLPLLLQAIITCEALHERTWCHIEITGFLAHRRAVPLSPRLEAVS